MWWIGKKINTIDASSPSKLINKTCHNGKVKDIEDKIPSITSLAATAALADFANKIPDISTLVKKQIMVQKYQKLGTK